MGLFSLHVAAASNASDVLKELLKKGSRIQDQINKKNFVVSLYLRLLNSSET